MGVAKTHPNCTLETAIPTESVTVLTREVQCAASQVSMPCQGSLPEGPRARSTLNLQEC